MCLQSIGSNSKLCILLHLLWIQGNQIWLHLHSVCLLFLLLFVWERARDARTLVMLTYLSGAIHRREVVIVILLEWRMQIRFFEVFVLKMHGIIGDLLSLYLVCVTASLGQIKVDCALKGLLATQKNTLFACIAKTPGFHRPMPLRRFSVYCLDMRCSDNHCIWHYHWWLSATSTAC